MTTLGKKKSKKEKQGAEHTMVVDSRLGSRWAGQVAGNKSSHEDVPHSYSL